MPRAALIPLLLWMAVARRRSPGGSGTDSRRRTVLGLPRSVCRATARGSWRGRRPHTLTAGRHQLCGLGISDAACYPPRWSRSACCSSRSGTATGPPSGGDLRGDPACTVHADLRRGRPSSRGSSNGSRRATSHARPRPLRPGRPDRAFPVWVGAAMALAVLVPRDRWPPDRRARARAGDKDPARSQLLPAEKYRPSPVAAYATFGSRSARGRPCYRHHRAEAVAPVLLAVVVRALLFLHFPDPAYPDSYYYVDVARSLAAGHGFNIDFIWIFVEVGGKLPANPALPVPSNAHWMPLASWSRRRSSGCWDRRRWRRRSPFI